MFGLYGPTMDDRFAVLKTHYNHNVSAEALLFANSHDQKALRLEVPDIGKEFTDGVYIGKDPKGEFYYNDIDDLNKTTHINYKCNKVMNPYDDETCMSIKFYTATVDEPIAEFLAYDPGKTLEHLGMEGYSHKGIWKEIDTASATATVQKRQNARQLTISIPAIKKMAVIDVPDGSLEIDSVNVRGLLHFKDADSLVKGKVARYHKYNIVFYENSYLSKEFTAYFIPYESSATNLGGKFNLELSVTWHSL